MTTSLIEYIKSNPTAALADVNNYEHIVVTNKVTSGKARSFFIGITESGVNKWTALRTIQQDLTHPLFPLADGIIGVINESSYFGLDPTTSVGQANLEGIATLVLAQFLTQQQADAFIAMGASRTYPFANTTQAEFDALKIEQSAKGATEGVISYDTLGNTDAFHVRSNTTKTMLEIALPAPVAYDTVFTVYASNKSGINESFVELPQAVSTNDIIKAGSTGTLITLEKHYGRHTKYRVVSDRIDDFNVLVTSINKY